MTRPNASWYFPKIFVKDANVFLSPLFWHIVFVVDVVVAVAVAIVVILGFFACFCPLPPPLGACLIGRQLVVFFPKLSIIFSTFLGSIFFVLKSCSRAARKCAWPSEQG